MSESVYTAILVMSVGMITVFTILGLVVVGGNLLIRFSNKFLPEEQKGLQIVQSAPIPAAVAQTKGQTKPETLAAIVAAVEVVTGGRGRIVEVKKVKKVDEG